VETVIIWFRQDLRLADNPAWARALERGCAVAPVYVYAPGDAGRWAPGGAARWWLHHALDELDRQLREKGLRLIIRRGSSEPEIMRLAEETGAAGVYWNRCYEPWRMRIDGRIKNRLKADGREGWSGNASLLREPWEVATQAGSAYKVFTPYSRACARLREPAAFDSAGAPPAPRRWPVSLRLDELGLLPKSGWDKGLAEFWTPTRQGGLGRLGAFLKGRAAAYGTARDHPWTDGTSRLSPYLHFGQIGPREVASAIRKQGAGGAGLEAFHRELIWREFAYHVLYHFPDTPERPLQGAYRDFPWRSDAAEDLAAWRAGRTGYPVVDAGMRQLWRTGWMHNRVRMIVASLLVKHLLISWEEGARWFWDTLVDADLASNTLG
jgi:deoxyribodipyrimidine photo-lyase